MLYSIILKELITTFTDPFIMPVRNSLLKGPSAFNTFRNKILRNFEFGRPPSVNH